LSFFASSASLKETSTFTFSPPKVVTSGHEKPLLHLEHAQPPVDRLANRHVADLGRHGTRIGRHRAGHGLRRAEHSEPTFCWSQGGA
jgi:hypothetical protein